MLTGFEEEVSLRRNKLKKEIRLAFGKCSKILLILGILTQVIGVCIVLFIKYRADIMHLSMNINNNTGRAFGLSIDLYNFLISYMPCILGELIAIFIGFRITKLSFKRDLFCKNKSKAGFTALACFACIGTGIISSIVYLIYSTLLGAGGVSIPEPDFNMPNNNSFMLIVFLSYVCIIGPVLEEIIFRGLILKSMKRYGNFTAVITTSILFAMFHLNLVQFVQPILIGMILGFVTLKSESIIPAIIIHIFNNTAVFFMSEVLSQQNTLTLIISSIYTLGGAIMLILFISKFGKEFIKLANENTKLLKVSKKIKSAFLSKWFIIYFAFYIFMVGTSILYINLTM